MVITMNQSVTISADEIYGQPNLLTRTPTTKIGETSKALPLVAKKSGSHFTALEDHDEIEIDMHHLNGREILASSSHPKMTRERQDSMGKERGVVTLEEVNEVQVRLQWLYPILILRPI